MSLGGKAALEGLLEDVGGILVLWGTVGRVACAYRDEGTPSGESCMLVWVW